MLLLHRVNGEPLYLAVPHILSVDPGPDTRIHLTTGGVQLVAEDASHVVDAVGAWYASIGAGTVPAASTMATSAVRHALLAELD